MSEFCILLIACEPVIYKYLKTFTVTHHLGLIQCSSLDLAFSQTAETAPHLIILDLEQEPEERLKMVQSLREHRATAHIPILVISRFKNAQDIHNTYARGASYILLKPFQVDQLYFQINTLLGQSLLPVATQNSKPQFQAFESKILSGYSILLADDDPGIQSVMAEIMRELGCKLLLAKNGKACLKMLEKEQPDLLFLNLNMPVIGGFEVLQILHNRDFTVPVIVLSGDSSIRTRQQVKELGAVAYLTKPFRLEDVVQLLETVLLSD